MPDDNSLFNENVLLVFILKTIFKYPEHFNYRYFKKQINNLYIGSNSIISYERLQMLAWTTYEHNRNEIHNI